MTEVRRISIFSPALPGSPSGSRQSGRFSYMARKYSKGAQEKVHRVMHEYKAGTLKSGRSRKPVKSRKQAIAIGLSEARKQGKKVPPPKQ